MLLPPNGSKNDRGKCASSCASWNTLIISGVRCVIIAVVTRGTVVSSRSAAVPVAAVRNGRACAPDGGANISAPSSGKIRTVFHTREHVLNDKHYTRAHARTRKRRAAAAVAAPLHQSPWHLPRPAGDTPNAHTYVFYIYINIMFTTTFYQY